MGKESRLLTGEELQAMHRGGLPTRVDGERHRLGRGVTRPGYNARQQYDPDLTTYTAQLFDPAAPNYCGLPDPDGGWYQGGDETP